MAFRRVSFLLLVLFAASAFAAPAGRVTGRITRADGSGISGVIAQALGADRAALTEANGSYSLDVPPGNYTVRFSVGSQVADVPNVTVVAGETVHADKQVDWKLSVAETITVYSASRRSERIVEAPAAVSVATKEEIEAVSPSGQAPRVIETAPGVDFTQSGLYDFNFNTRGFNSSLNRRVLTLIDGRDPSVPFLGAQEWAALSYPVDEMESVELVRGPGSALYGANAFAGVLNMVTKQPRGNKGGRLRLTGGELNMRRADARYAGELGSEWYYRVVGGYQQSDDFTRSRNASVEYAGLRREAVPLALEKDTISFGGARLDHHFENSNVMTLEGGYATLEGPTFLTGIGRVQTTDVQHPWARVNYNALHYNISGYYDGRKATDQIALASGAHLFEDSHNIHGEVQTNWGFLADKVHTVLGVAYNQQEVDTANPAGVQTLMDAAKKENQQAAFGQLEWNVGDKVKLVGAARYDDSTLHEAQFSPKAAIVYSATPNHIFRYGYNRAFQRPNYSELFLRAPAAAPVNLAAIENAFKPLLGGTALGFSAIPVLAFGNPLLDVEKVRSHELGYAGIYHGKVYVTVDYYKSRLSDFVTDLLPGVNPAFPAYKVPAGVPAPVAAQILATLQKSLPTSPLPLYVAMTNLPNGAPAFVISYANAGEVDTQGVELAFNYYITNNWTLDANYSWFDFEVKKQALGDQLLPNSPENKVNVGLSWRGPRMDAKVSYRWVDGFPWATGVFVGPVPSYDVVNVTANFHINDTFGVGVDVANALDNKHWETFGGDILKRRALGYVMVNW
jgi:outer membrane receptor protein involved in Fe transport